MANDDQKAVEGSPLPALPAGGIILPAIIADVGEAAARRFVGVWVWYGKRKLLK